MSLRVAWSAGAVVPTIHVSSWQRGDRGDGSALMSVAEGQAGMLYSVRDLPPLTLIGPRAALVWYRLCRTARRAASSGNLFAFAPCG